MKVLKPCGLGAMLLQASRTLVLLPVACNNSCLFLLETLWLNSCCHKTAGSRIVSVNPHDAWLVGGKTRHCERQSCKTAPAAFNGLWLDTALLHLEICFLPFTVT